MNRKGKNLLNTLISAVILTCLLISGSICNVYAGNIVGDVNNDGVLTFKDVRALNNYVRNNEFNGVEEFDFTNSDIDGDGKVTATDVAKAFSLADLSDKTKDINLFILGDSTGCNYTSKDDINYYYKRVGFGTKIGEYFEDNVKVTNLAVSGSSSKSFTSLAYYQTYLNSISEGDYVIIAFGHNDEKQEVPRYTNPNGDKNTEGSFQNSLYVNYIKPALDKGAIPILATPIVRRTSSGAWSNEELHIYSDKTVNGVIYEGGDYSQAIRDLANDLNLYLIDNTEMTKALYDELTPSETVYLHAWTSSNPKSVDRTHLNNYGAAYISYLMAKNLKSSVVELGESVKDNIVEPNKEYLIVNPDYIEPDPSAELVDDGLWNTTEPWIGTVYGDVGTNPVVSAENRMNTEFFNIEELENNSVNIRMGNPETSTQKGKISSGSDGVAMYFQKVSASTNFELSATANINGFYATNSQSGFGIMVTDTLGMNEKQTLNFNNYAVAGALGTASYYVNFSRTDGTLKNNYNDAITEEADKPLAGTKVYLKVVKVRDKITVTYTTETGKEYKNEIDFNPTEGTNTIYTGLFATRCADITYTDINFNNEVAE